MNCGRRLPACSLEWRPQYGVPIRLDRGSRKVVRARALIVMAGPRAQRPNDGGNVIRACALLPAVTGNLMQNPGRAFCI